MKAFIEFKSSFGSKTIQFDWPHTQNSVGRWIRRRGQMQCSMKCIFHRLHHFRIDCIRLIFSFFSGLCNCVPCCCLFLFVFATHNIENIIFVSLWHNNSYYNLVFVDFSFVCLLCTVATAAKFGACIDHFHSYNILLAFFIVSLARAALIRLCKS